jgi:Rap1a immunity proteins
MKWLRAIWPILILTSQPVAADGAYFVNGNFLHDACQKGVSMDRTAFCVGYVGGIADALSQDSVQGHRSCIPAKSVTNIQLMDVVEIYLANHPERRHEMAASLVALSLSAAFPCAQ